MTQTPPVTPVLDISNTQDGGRIHIVNSSEVADWVVSERDGWEQLLKPLGQLPNHCDNAEMFQRLKNEINQHFSALEARANAIKRESQVATLRELAGEFETRYRAGFSIPLTNGYRFAALQELVQENPYEALGATTLLWRVSPSGRMLGFAVSGMQRIMKEGQFASDPRAWDRQMQTVVDRANESSAQAAERIESNARQVQDLRDQLLEFQRSRESEWGERLKRFELEEQRIIALFHDHMATRSAVRYWSERALAASILETKWERRVFWLVVSTPVLVLGLGSCFERLRSGSGGNGAPLSEVFQILASGRLLVAGMCIWLIRLAVRNYLSARHQEADANERVILIQTYLALLQDESIAKDSELRKTMLPAMLQTIFRHASDGYVKDDALPTNGVSLISGGKP